MAFYRLSTEQLQRLKSHKYSAEGTSLAEPPMQVFWNWLITMIPLWIAPNLLTGVALLINFLTILPVLLQDMNLEGVAPSWCYVVSAAGLFIYQAMDAIDGKQARRTGSANQLGELFDHGCDAISLYLLLLAGVSAVGLHDYPFSLLMFVVLLGNINFVYHWQTYVCGTLHFNLLDVTEGQFMCIALMIVRAGFGIEIWNYELPVCAISLKALLVIILLVVSLINMLFAVHIILTSGVGKNGTSVANTSVVSPVVTSVVVVPVAFLYASLSPSPIAQHSLLFVSAMCLPTIKATMSIILSGMTKTPYPLVDYIMLLPWLALLNVYIGTPLPETLVLGVVLLWEVVDLLSFSASVCVQVAHFLQVAVFSLPKSS